MSPLATRQQEPARGSTPQRSIQCQKSGQKCQIKCALERHFNKRRGPNRRDQRQQQQQQQFGWQSFLY